MPILPVNVFHILQANINLYPHQLESDAVLYFSPIPFIHNQWHCFPSIFRMDLGNCAHLLNTTYPDGLPESGILLISTSLLKALAYLHTNRIIHRAVCAENIFMDSDGEIRLALANQSIRIDDCPRWIGQLDKVHHFSGLELLFVWLAPEVLRQDLNGYGLKSDLYSFGICLCELANGIAPFTEMEPLQILYEKLHGTTPFLLDSTTCDVPTSQNTFSSELHEIINELLKIEPEERPSASELLEKYGDSIFTDLGSQSNKGEKLRDALSLAKKIF